MLTYIDGYEVGDCVQIGETSGVVTKASVLTTQVRTANQKTITLPNSIVMGSAMVNYSAAKDKGTLIPLTVGIGYDAPWRQVEWLMLQAAARTPGLNRKIDPLVLIVSLNQFDVTYELNAFLQAGEVLGKVRSLLARNVLDLFNEYGVQIMTPSYEGNPDYAVVAPKWNPPPTAESTEGRAEAIAR
jgi:small-conductance mechanosensitive channel